MGPPKCAEIVRNDRSGNSDIGGGNSGIRGGNSGVGGARLVCGAFGLRDGVEERSHV